MSELVERAARLIDDQPFSDLEALAAGRHADAHPHYRRDLREQAETRAAQAREKARAVLREMLAAMREPSEAMAVAYWHLRDGEPLLIEHVDRAQQRMTVVLDAFAREHDLEMGKSED